MRVLVTGATGFVGNNVVRLLCERGLSVRVLVRSSAVAAPLVNLPIEIHQGDILDAGSVDRACRDVTGIIHAAANVHVGWKHNEPQWTCNVDGTRHIATAALAGGAKLVYVSTINTLGLTADGTLADEETPPGGMPDIGYVRSKIAAEQVIQEFVQRGLQASIVNPGFMFGPWDWKPTSGRMLLAVAQRWAPFAPSGGCSVCDVRDVAAGILSALERGTPGRRYILGGENLSYLELWTLIAQMAHKQKPWVKTGPIMRLVAGWYGDLRGWLTGQEPDINSAAMAVVALKHYYRSDRARAELGYHSRPVAETLRDAWAWFKEHGYVGSPARIDA